MAYFFYAAAFFSLLATVLHAACAIMAYKHWKASTSNPPEGFTAPPHAFYRTVWAEHRFICVNCEHSDIHPYLGDRVICRNCNTVQDPFVNQGERHA